MVIPDVMLVRESPYAPTREESELIECDVFTVAKNILCNAARRVVVVTIHAVKKRKLESRSRIH